MIHPTANSTIAPVASTTNRYQSASSVTTQPKYNINQEVGFIGGRGRIKHCYPGSGTWIYTIEMEMGPEPAMGRIGEETTILLDEPEIDGLVNVCSPPLCAAA